MPGVGAENMKDLATYCVLQTILGGGASFSTGGPGMCGSAEWGGFFEFTPASGKGMHSMLYSGVLNRNHWVDLAEASHHTYTGSGMFAVVSTACMLVRPRMLKWLLQVGSSHPADSNRLVTVLIEALASAKKVRVSQLFV